ncbi:nicotinamide mononucleotide transporter [Desulfurobacterium sp.]
MERTKGQKILEIVASVFGVTGLFITALGYPNIGFMVALCASTLYAIYAYKTKQYGILTSSLIYGIVEIIGIIHWTLNNGK